MEPINRENRDKMKCKNKGKEKIEVGDLVAFARQCGRTRLAMFKFLGIPIRIKKVRI